MYSPKPPTPVQATNQSRALYNELKRRYSGAIITESFLYLMKSIQGTITTVAFDVLNNVGSPNVNEVRLNITDKFAVKEMSMVLVKAGASATATAAEISVSRPSTYPNSIVFPGAAEAANLEAIYNGTVRIVIDSQVYYQTLDMRRFYRVSPAQQGVALSTQGAGAAPGIYQRDGWDSLNYSFTPVVPSFELNGIGKNEITVTLPNPTLTQGTNSQNFLGCYLRGFLIQNVNQGR